MRKFVGPLDLFGAVGPNGHAVHVHWFLACNEVSHVELDATFLRMGNLDALGTHGDSRCKPLCRSAENVRLRRTRGQTFHLQLRTFTTDTKSDHEIYRCTRPKLVINCFSTTHFSQKTQHGIESQLMGHGGFGFFSGCPSATIPFIGRSQESKPLTQTIPNQPLTIS